jgi:lipid A 4'-phosphatase
MHVFDPVRFCRARLFRWDWLVFLGCVAVYFAFPKLDLWITNHLFSLEEGFVYQNLPGVQFSYRLFARLHFVFLIGLPIYWVVTRFFWPRYRHTSRYAAFLLVALLLGPGLVVNYALKEHWGRARPEAITQYGGDAQYTSPLQPAEQCRTNCSFVSGHASMGFFAISLAWVLRRRRWFWAGLALGGLVGLGRMLQGGHFFADVVFSFWAVYFSLCLTAGWMGIDPHRAD